MNMKPSLRIIVKYPLIFVFFMICFGAFLTYLIKPDAQFSQMENRYLTTRPAISLQTLLDGTFMSNFETYCNEQVPLRNALVRGKAAVSQAQFRCENDGVSKGKDGYLFDKTLSRSNQFSKNVSAISNFAKNMSDRQREVYITIAPTSVWINEDKLPKGMPVLDEAECSNELTLALNDGEIDDNVHTVYLYDVLKASEEKQLYYRTDHHWTSDAAYIAYGKIMEEMGLKPQDISSYARLEARDFLGTSYAKFKGFGVEADTIGYYDFPIKELRLEKQTVNNLYDLQKFDTYDKYGAFMYGNDGKYEVVCGDEDVENGADLIIVKDSYANCLIPYLTMNFNDIIVVDLRYYGSSLNELIDENADAKILLLYNWSFVNEDNHFYKLVK